MKPASIALRIAAALCLLALGVAAFWSAHSLAAARADLRATGDALAGSVAAARADLAATQAALVHEVQAARESADARLAEALREVRSARVNLRDQLASANATAAGLRADVRPILENATVAVLPYGSLGAEATRLARNANDSWDDLYLDVSAAVQSATVASRGVAEASEAVGKAAPAVAQAAELNVPVMLDDSRQIVKNVRRGTSLPMVILKFAWDKTLGRLF